MNSMLGKLTVILLVVAIVLAVVGVAVQLADFDVDTNVGGQTFILETDWTAGQVTYTGSAPDFEVNVSGEQTFVNGMGDFQAAVGFLKGTSKERTNSISPYTTDFLGKRAKLNVSARTDTIPWWAVGVAVPCEIEVELLAASNVSELTIDRVYFEYVRVIDGKVQTMEAWSQTVSDPLEEVGDNRTYSTELEVSEDWGEFRLFGMVEVTMKDVDDVTATHVYKSWADEPNTITLWTIPTVQGVKIAMIIVAMPVFLMGAFLAVAAIITILRGARYKLVLSVSAVALLLLGALFFRIGVAELATLVGYPDDVTFTSGYMLMLAAFVPALMATLLVGRVVMKYEPEEEEAPGAPPPKADSPEEGEKTISDEDTIEEEDVE